MRFFLKIKAFTCRSWMYYVGDEACVKALAERVDDTGECDFADLPPGSQDRSTGLKDAGDDEIRIFRNFWWIKQLTMGAPRKRGFTCSRWIHNSLPEVGCLGIGKETRPALAIPQLNPQRFRGPKRIATGGVRKITGTSNFLAVWGKWL